MTYLIVDNNLGDLTDPYEARLNLGLGDLSTMNSNQVKITGGSIRASRFKLKPNDDVSLNSNNYFLRSVDAEGTVDWFQIPSMGWLNSNQGEISISKFKNDANFISHDELALVAFSGDFNDLSNIPIRLSEVYSNDVLHHFLYRESNLSDISDPKVARTNLGLGDLALQNVSHVTISNLTVTDEFKFPESIGNGYIFVDANANGEAFLNTIPTFPIATSNTLGVVFVKDHIDSNSAEGFVPSMTLFSNTITDLNEKIVDLKMEYLNDIVDLVGGDQFLFKSNLLAEFQSEYEKTVARSNLGCGDLCTQNSNDVICCNLTVEHLNFRFKHDDSNDSNDSNDTNLNGIDKKILSFNSNYESVFLDMNHFMATSNSPGAMYISDVYDHYHDSNEDASVSVRSNASTTVLSMHAVSNYVSEFNMRLSDIQASIPTNVSQLHGNDQYMRKENNLSDLTDVDVAKSNLQLAKVATTGAYADLTDKPFAISSFSNDLGFLVGNCNLSDIVDPIQARNNLGLGSMATQDINNVRIQGGIVRFKKLEIKNEFFYKDDANVPNGKILVCADRNGLMEWQDLPKASFNTYGTVQISDHIKLNDSRTDVVPTCKVFSVIEENLRSKLESAMRDYLLSAEFSDRLANVRQVQVDKIDALNDTIRGLIAEEEDLQEDYSNLQHESTTAFSNLQYQSQTSYSNIEYRLNSANELVLVREESISNLESNLASTESDVEVLRSNLEDTWDQYSNISTLNVLFQSRVSWPTFGVDNIAPSGLSSGSWMVGSMTGGTACSSDGTTVMMSGMNHEINDRGTTVAFKYDGSTWSQMGSPIDGDGVGDLSGFSISMSANGHIISIASPTHSDGHGRVRILTWNSDSQSWDDLGDLYGESVEHFGTSVALSADGTRIACSSIYGEESTFSETETQSKGWFYPGKTTSLSRVRVYEYESTSSSWGQIGEDIVGENNSAFGWSVDLSQNGTRLIVGAPGQNSHASVYHEENGIWTQIGTSPTDFCGDDQEGMCVAISNDGKRIASSALLANSEAGRVRVFEEKDGSWSQVGSTFDSTDNARIGLNLALSKDDGKTLIFGNFHWQGVVLYDPSYTVYRERDGVWSKYGTRVKTGDDCGSLAISHDGKRVFLGQPTSNSLDGTIRPFQDPVHPELIEK